MNSWTLVGAIAISLTALLVVTGDYSKNHTNKVNNSEMSSEMRDTKNIRETNTTKADSDTTPNIGTNSSDRNTNLSENISPQNTGPKLRLESWRCYKEHGYQYVSGEVTNITNMRLENVMVVGKFQDFFGEFVKSDSAIVEYNPILPGQTTPFRTGTTSNPQIENCEIDFKYLMGGTISYITAESERLRRKSQVEYAQQLLNKLGYDAGDTTGYINDSTRKAIKSFQRAQGRRVDGEFDQNLLQTLKNISND
jgi:hypothetical protein